MNVNVGLRAEYFYQDVLDEMTNLTKMETMREWLKSAFEAGKKSVDSQK